MAEALLFGNQPFIADMTAHALTVPDDTAKLMTASYQRRAGLLQKQFLNVDQLEVLMPKAGMFMLLDVSGSGMDGEAFAQRLLHFGVSAMPGNAFGERAKDFIRLSLTVDDAKLVEAARRIVRCAQGS